MAEVEVLELEVATTFTNNGAGGAAVPLLGHGGTLVVKVPGAMYVAEVPVCETKLPQLFVVEEHFPNPFPG